MKTLFRLPASAALLALLAAGAGAQRGAQSGRPAPGPAAPQQAQPSQQQVRQQAQEQVRAQRAPEPGSPAWHTQRRETARSMVREEHAYRMRVARIERMQEIYRGQGRMDRVRELDRLRTRAREMYSVQQRTCRQTLGEQDFLRLQDRIEERARLRDGTGDGVPDRDRDQDRLRTRQEPVASAEEES